MEVPTISALRPKGNDAASIEAAIAAAETARATALEHVGQIARAAKSALLTATDEELDAAERDADNARRDADRIDALLDELRGALANAVTHAAHAGVRALQADAERLAEALDAAIRKSYPAALATVTALIEKEEFAEAALRRWARARHLLIQSGQATAADLPEPPAEPSAQLGGRDLLRNLVQMPTLDGKLDAALGALAPAGDLLCRQYGIGEGVAFRNAQLAKSAAWNREQDELARRNAAARAGSFDRAHGPARFAATPVPADGDDIAISEPIGTGWDRAMARVSRG